MAKRVKQAIEDKVAPLAGAWIEISIRLTATTTPQWVAPLAGAWIEIASTATMEAAKDVAPLAGAWIEIRGMKTGNGSARVAPLAGAWIEIECPSKSEITRVGSLPSRERGLKYNKKQHF